MQDSLVCWTYRVFWRILVSWRNFLHMALIFHSPCDMSAQLTAHSRPPCAPSHHLPPPNTKHLAIPLTSLLLLLCRARAPSCAPYEHLPSLSSPSTSGPPHNPKNASLKDPQPPSTPSTSMTTHLTSASTSAAFCMPSLT